MPPFIPKKRRATTPLPDEIPPPQKKAKAPLPDKAKAKSLSQRKKSKKPVYTVSSDDSDSSLSSIDSAEFESVALGKATTKKAPPKAVQVDDDSDQSDEVEWEEAIDHHSTTYVPKEPAKVSGDVQFSLEANEDEFGGFAAAALQRKQGISKAEKATRIAAHQLHVQFLLWHNAVRNQWISDKVVQTILMDQLPTQIKSEVEKWRRASGFVDIATSKKKSPKKKHKSKKEKPMNDREERDWGRPSQRLEVGKADMSSGDPIISLLKVLSLYWKKRFAITAPGLRKRGYSTRLERRKEVNSFKTDPHDPEKHGEKICDIKEFREIARKCEGSRDVGAQLFTALLRGLGIEARLVASLQPAGFGATKAEEMLPKKVANGTPSKRARSPSSSSDSDVKLVDIETINASKKKGKASERASTSQPSRRKSMKTEDLDDLESGSLSSSDSDKESILDVTPSVPKRRTAMYDREVPAPIYWTEAISPITSKVYPTSPLVLEKSVATNDELLGNFEPRGAKADKAKLVMAYVVAYSQDGTAKDVTVRYLRKHIWPGKTKAFRYPIEKIPVYDRTGRIKRYEDYDWFKHTISGYARSDKMRTAVDDVEDSTDLVKQQPEKKQVDETVDTLSSLKASQEFVLARFLRREEAIRPDAEPDRMFFSGKDKTLKEEPVYRRSDVERCLTTESWHKEGRIPRLGEAPMKHVPVRAVTLTRKREAEEHERITGEKQLQGLYSWDQTEYIIPPPIRDGVIPKNGYGNIDAFVPSMVPKGAAHIPLKGTLRICKRLEIDYAEAVVGFEFGNKRAIPVIKGVVVAKEHEKMVREEWKKWHEEQKRKEEMKLEKLVLELWRKFIVGLKIRKRVQEQYGEDVEMGGGSTEVDNLPEKIRSGLSKAEAIDVEEEDEAEPSGLNSEVAGQNEAEDDEAGGGGFFLPHSDEEMSEAGELIMEDHNAEQDAIPLRRRRIASTSPEATDASGPRSEINGTGNTNSGRKKSLLQQRANLEVDADTTDSALPLPASDSTSARQVHANGFTSDQSSNASDASENSSASDSSANESDESEAYNPMSKPATKATSTRRRITRDVAGPSSEIRRTSSRLTTGDTTPAARRRKIMDSANSDSEENSDADEDEAEEYDSEDMVISPYFKKTAAAKDKGKGKASARGRGRPRKV